MKFNIVFTSLMLFLTAVNTQAAITNVTVSPGQRAIVATSDTQLTVTWRVTSDFFPRLGIDSASATVINPATNTTLATIAGAINLPPAGPFVASETLQLTKAQVQGWLSQGLRKVVIARTFVDPGVGSSRQAAIVVQLNRSSLTAVREGSSGTLLVQGLRLEFDNGNNLKLTEQGGRIRARLTVVHGGSGLLEGRWQIADPGSSDAKPLYRTLALVRRHLTGQQRSVIDSPLLPTGFTGKYLLRFCVTNRNQASGDFQTNSLCPSEQFIVTAAYQVNGSDLSIAEIRGLSPNQQGINDTTLFSWLPVPGTRIYQLQVFELAASDAALASSKNADATVEPVFVVGMVLPAATSEVPLSQLVLSKLVSGKRYLWRVTAHDPSGRLLASSEEASFIYLQEAR